MPFPIPYGWSTLGYGWPKLPKESPTFHNIRLCSGNYSVNPSDHHHLRHEDRFFFAGLPMHHSGNLHFEHTHVTDVMTQPCQDASSILCNSQPEKRFFWAHARKAQQSATKRSKAQQSANASNDIYLNLPQLTHIHLCTSFSIF